MGRPSWNLIGCVSVIGIAGALTGYALWLMPVARQQRLDLGLMSAIMAQNTEAAQTLLDRGANANAHYPEPANFMSLLAPQPQRDLSENNAVAAVYSGVTWDSGFFHPPKEDFPLMDALIRHGGDPNSHDDHGYSVLFKAAVSGHLETVRMLLDHGADPNPRCGWPAANTRWYSYLAKDPQVVRLLRSYGAHLPVRAPGRSA